jgi:hypothetical protein
MAYTTEKERKELIESLKLNNAEKKRIKDFMLTKIIRRSVEGYNQFCRLVENDEIRKGDDFELKITIEIN